jgi:hypothetical protein
MCALTEGHRILNVAALDVDDDDDDDDDAYCGPPSAAVQRGAC